MRALVILAGGKSSRMGRDKVFLPYNGKTFLEHVYSSMLPFFDRIIISSGSEGHSKEIAKLFGEKAVEIVADNYKEAGPIGGILSVFEETDIEKFAIISVDVVNASGGVLARLYDECEKEACLLAANGRCEPLIAAYSKDSYHAFKHVYESGSNKIRAVFSFIKCKEIEFEQLKKEGTVPSFLSFEEMFANVNTMKEYESIEQ